MSYWQSFDDRVSLSFPRMRRNIFILQLSGMIGFPRNCTPLVYIKWILVAFLFIFFFFFYVFYSRSSTFHSLSLFRSSSGLFDTNVQVIRNEYFILLEVIIEWRSINSTRMHSFDKTRDVFISIKWVITRAKY